MSCSCAASWAPARRVRARRRVGARRQRPDHQPDVQHWSPLPGDRDDDRLAPRPLPPGDGLQARIGLLDDYLGPGRIAFVEWPAQDSAEAVERARARDTPTRRRPPADRGGRGMIVLGFDTATRSTAVAAPADGLGRCRHGRDRSRTGRAPGTRHATTGHGGGAARGRWHCWSALERTRSAADRAASRACAWASPPRAGWRSGSGSSSSARSGAPAGARGGCPSEWQWRGARFRGRRKGMLAVLTLAAARRSRRVICPTSGDRSTGAGIAPAALPPRSSVASSRG